MLKGENVGLRPLETEDAWLLYRWFNDQRVLEDLGAEHLYFAISMEEERRIVEHMVNDQDALWFIVQRLKGEEAIGIVGLANLEARTASAELRIVIGEPGQWGKGHGAEAIQMLLDHAFNVKNLHRVYLRVVEYNQRAISCYKKCGFMLEGRTRHDHFHKGRWRDALRMSILEDEFRGRKDASG
jgi:RimJ/RimL family protein N-acetyltransferase